MQFNLVSIGDYMTGENVHHYRRGIPKKFKNNYRSLIDEKVERVISSGDMLFLNFESSLAHEDELVHYSIDKAVYVAPLETLKLLTSLNVPIIANIANNHFGQHGIESCKYTIKKLEDEGVIVIGKDRLPATYAEKGMITKIWGVSLIEDKYYEGGYFKSNYEDLINDLQLTPKGTNEIRILSIHWGDEYTTLENNAQKNLAKELSVLGFDLILGHHPHTIQPVEKIHNTWVVYSHGNFLFDQNFSSLTQTGLITKFGFPEIAPQWFFSKQKKYRVVDIEEKSVEEIQRYCKINFSKNSHKLMRIKMKAELLTHFYELNLPIIKTFATRLIG